MSGTIHIDDQTVIAFLDGLLKKANDLTPLMDGIGQRMETQISNRFETEADPMGVPWSPWAAETKATYPSDGNGLLLDRYGDLLISIGHEATADSVSYGFASPYAAYHEFGTKHMPRRGLLTADPEAGTLSPDDQAQVLDVIQSFLTP